MEFHESTIPMRLLDESMYAMFFCLRGTSTCYVTRDGNTPLLINILRIHQKVLPIFSNMYQILIPTARFAHIERIFALIGHSSGIVLVVIHNAPEDRVSKHTNSLVKLPLEDTFGKTYPMPLYISTATRFVARTYKSTNHESLISDECSKLSVNRRACPSLLHAGATVKTVM